MKSEFKKIAIICASERELAPFLPLIENPTVSERAMLRIHEGRLNGFEVAAVYCGVCKVNAAAAAQIMIDCYGADTVISAGASGGMAEDLQLFDTVVAAEACYHDVHERILTDYHPFMKTQFFPASSELVSAAKPQQNSLPNADSGYFSGAPQQVNRSLPTRDVRILIPALHRLRLIWNPLQLLMSAI